MNRALREALVLAVDRDRVVDLLKRMIQIKSYSGDEEALARFMAERMKEAGLEVTLREVEPRRPNAVGRWIGAEGPVLVFNGHLDTNPAGMGWTVNPLGGLANDRYVYGIGVSNMKAADAAFLEAVQACQALGLRPRGTVVLAYVVGELQGGIGTLHLLRSGFRADWFVVGEPTDLAVVTCHAGCFDFAVEVEGKTRHTSKYEEAVDAIARMEGVLRRLRRFRVRARAGRGLGFMSRLNVGAIRGGLSRECHEWRPAQVADFCRAKGSARMAPGQSPEQVLSAIGTLLTRLKGRDPKLRVTVRMIHEHQRVVMPPLQVPSSSPVVSSLIQSYRTVRGQNPRVGAVRPYCYYGTDAGHLAAAGMSGAVCGPGGKYNTMPDERVATADLVDAARIYAFTLADLVGLG